MSQNKATPITLYKEAPNGEMYKKEIFPSDWILPEGYECKVSVRADKDMADQFALQKAQYVITNFQQNPTALRIARRKQLEIMGWDDDEINEAMAAEEMAQDMAMPMDDGTEQIETPKGQATGRPFNNSQMIQQSTA